MTRVAAEQQARPARQLAGLDDLAVGQWSRACPGGEVEAGLDDAVVAERDAEAGVGAEQAALADEMTSLPPPDSVPMIDAPPPMSLPSPTTTPALMRPSTIDVPSVPALKFTKPSCMTVVPSARCAPRRTRSASAIAHAGRDDVVGHPRELVDAGDVRCRPAARARRRTSGSAAGSTGPRLVQATFGRTPKSPSRLTPCGRTRRWREQVQAQVGVGGVGGRRVEVDR